MPASPTGHAEDRLQHLESSLRRERALNRMALAALGVVALAGWTARRPPEVLHVRGLVVEDSLGRPRIVLGAPLTLPGRTAAQSGTGVAVLAESGALQAALGAPTPAPRIGGKVVDRVGGSAGLVVADRDGNERGGFGAFPDGRANACLDYAGGVKEAACLVVFPGDQMAGLVVNGTPDQKGFDRVTALVGKDGVAIMKLAAPSGRESVILRSQGDSPAELFVPNADGSDYVDVMPKPAR